MRVLPLIALALLFFFPASSFADNYKVLGNYKELGVEVNEVWENSVGLTKDDLERTVKLRLMRNGIKPITDLSGKQYLHVNVSILNIREGFAATTSVILYKTFRDYASPDHGASDDHLPILFKSGVVLSISTGSTKSQLLEGVETNLDDFILKYLEANME